MIRGGMKNIIIGLTAYPLVDADAGCEFLIGMKLAGCVQKILISQLPSAPTINYHIN